MNTALIDGDIIRYKAAFQSEYTLCTFSNGMKIRGKRAAAAYAKKTGLTYTCEVALDSVDRSLRIASNIVNLILTQTDATDYKIYFSGHNNHRYDLYPEYKLHREDQRKPTYLGVVSKYMQYHFDTVLCDGEADDALGRNSAEDNIICTIDKDLNQIPGLHYNWDKEEIYLVDEEEAHRIFYTSILTGDTSDNIPGLYKTTGQRCTQVIKNGLYNYDNIRGMWEYVKGHYSGQEDKARIYAQLLWIAHPDQEYWNEP